MTHGSIIGYDINAKMCQISYYNEKTQEPETVDTGIEKENNQIPLVMNYYKETWTYGRQARRMSTVRDSICVEGIWECALGNRKIEVDGQEYEGVQLLADFVLVKIEKEGVTSADVFEFLIKQGLMVRDCSSFKELGGEYFRFCIMAPEDNKRLLQGIQDFFA